MAQKHIHYSRIKLKDRVRYIALGTALTIGLTYYSGIDPVDKAKQLYQAHKHTIQQYSKKVTDFLR